MTTTAEAPAAERARKATTRKATAKVEAPVTEAAPATKRAPRRTRKTAHPVTVRKVALGVKDLPKALYEDALARVGGDPRNLYRVRVLSRNSYEMDLHRPRPA